MKNQFIVTKNVRRLYQLADTLQETGNKTPGLGLFYGEPGLGKTEAAAHMHLQKHSVYLRAKTAWTVLWFLNDLLHELGEKKAGKTENAYARIVEILSGQPRLVMLDEVDHMLHDGKVIETMRDIHDETGNPFLLIGMQDAKRKLKGYPHLYSRFADVVKAQKIKPDEILEISDTLCEMPLTKKAAEELFEATQGELRKIVVWLESLESLAKTNSMESITPKMIKKRNN